VEETPCGAELSCFWRSETHAQQASVVWLASTRGQDTRVPWTWQKGRRSAALRTLGWLGNTLRSMCLKSNTIRWRSTSPSTGGGGGGGCDGTLLAVVDAVRRVPTAGALLLSEKSTCRNASRSLGEAAAARLMIFARRPCEGDCCRHCASVEKKSVETNCAHSDGAFTDQQAASGVCARL
jgi:hypothetical protein